MNLKKIIVISFTIFFFAACEKEDTTLASEADKAQQTTDNTVKDTEGNVYKTVIIGNQTWISENLRATKYNDRTPIPLVTDNNEWKNLSTSAYSWYNNDSAAYSKTYGALYNWYAVQTEKLCPSGWKVPSENDWDELREYLIANGHNYDGTTTGNKIAKAMGATHTWSSSTATGGIGNTNNEEFRNKSGFTALPAGNRYATNGTYNDHLKVTHFWNSSELSSTSAYRYGLYSYHDFLNKDVIVKEVGLSVRCIMDK